MLIGGIETEALVCGPDKLQELGVKVGKKVKIETLSDTSFKVELAF